MNNVWIRNRTFQKMLKFFHIPFFCLFLDNLYIACKHLVAFIYAIHFFSMWVFLHRHSQFTGQQGKGEGIYLTPLYHFYLLHRHLDISWAIDTESSPLCIASAARLKLGTCAFQDSLFFLYFPWVYRTFGSIRW